MEGGPDCGEGRGAEAFYFTPFPTMFDVYQDTPVMDQTGLWELSAQDCGTIPTPRSPHTSQAPSHIYRPKTHTYEHDTVRKHPMGLLKLYRRAKAVAETL